MQGIPGHLSRCTAALAIQMIKNIHKKKSEQTDGDNEFVTS